MKLNVPIKILNEDATLPTYGSEYSAGADLYSIEACEISPHETMLVHTGVALQIPDGYVGLIYARSGLATKRSLAPANKVGVIDSDYRGEIMVSLHNHSNVVQSIEKGERVAQIVFTQYATAEFNVLDELTKTDRDDGGFGSTGTK